MICRIFNIYLTRRFWIRDVKRMIDESGLGRVATRPKSLSFFIVFSNCYRASFYEVNA